MHEVVDVFKKDVLPHAEESIRKEFSDILTKIRWIEKRWIDTRYEIESGGKIEIPSFVFKTEDALEGIDIAEKTLEISRQFLEFHFKTKIPKKLENLEEIIRSAL